MITSGQICKMSYKAYCNMSQPYCNILQYAFCHIVSPPQYMIFKIPYGTHSSIVLDKCHKKISPAIPNNKFLDWTKLKRFADDKVNVAKMIIFLLCRVENIVGKGENAPFPTMFSKDKLPQGI